MIVDHRVLDEQFVPNDLHHRDGEIDHLSSALRPIVAGHNAENALVFGQSGTGKTTIAKYVCQQLESRTPDVRWGYVDCTNDSTATGALYSLIRDAGLGLTMPRNGTSKSMLVDRLRDYDGHFVAVVDEVDVLEDTSLLLTLYQVPKVSMVAICVDQDHLFADLDSRAKSRLRSAVSVNLDPYSREEMCDILWGRVEAALPSGSIDQPPIDAIADPAAGDARCAISTLRLAARHTVENGRDLITVEDVEAVADDARADIRERYVEKLSTHQRLLYKIVRDAGEISASDLHAAYEDRAKEPKSRATRRRYLDSLEREDMIDAVGDTRARRYLLSE